eukprot:SAG11_NODE_29324_length_312_cov_0.713615_1_plen_50_part_10
MTTVRACTSSYIKKYMNRASIDIEDMPALWQQYKIGSNGLTWTKISSHFI